LWTPGLALGECSCFHRAVASTQRPILLIVPPVTFEAVHPLGLASLATRLLEAGETVAGLDLRLDPDGLDRIPRPELVVIETSIRNVATVRRLARTLRDRWQVPIALTGSAAALHPERLLGPDGADAATMGDPEVAIPALLAHLRGTGGPVPGVRLAGDERAAPATPGPFLAPGDLPAPDRTVFPLRRYTHAGSRPGRVSAAIETSRGCTLACTFCPVPARYGGTCRVRDTAAVLDEMARLNRDHGVDAFAFEDEQPLLDRATFESLLAGIRHRLPGVELAFPNGLRPDLLDRDLIDVMAASGARQVALGIESPSAEVRARLGRPFDDGHLADLLDAMRTRGLVTTGYYMAGLPQAGPDEARALLAAVTDPRLDYVHVSVCWPWRDVVELPTPGMRQAAWVRTAAYLTAYGDPRRAFRLAREGHLTPRRLPWVVRRLGAWILSGTRGGGGW
jgi:radical SAM superfamily enzyme YgiQ (UPF0313 family)